MARESKEMSAIRDQLAIVQAQIAKLRVQEELLVDLMRKITGEGMPVAAPMERLPARKRSPSVKPLVLDLVIAAGAAGITTREVDDAVRVANPSVARDTVGSVLSRLKSDGALKFDGERYYTIQFAPSPRPFEPPTRSMN